MQFHFLSEYVMELLTQNGLGNLSEEQKNVYLPQLTARVEERLGMALLPKLPESEHASFAELLEKENVSPEEWSTFWHKAIPNFDEEVKKVLVDFAKEVKQILTV